MTDITGMLLDIAATTGCTRLAVSLHTTSNVKEESHRFTVFLHIPGSGCHAGVGFTFSGALAQAEENAKKEAAA